MATVERIALVVQPNDAGGSTWRRWAILSDGRRVPDPVPASQSSGVSFGFGRPSADDERAMRSQIAERALERQRQAGASVLESLATAVSDTGVAVTAAELARVPVAVEHSDEVAHVPPVPGWKRRERRMKILAVAIQVVVGAFWPALLRKRTERVGFRRRARDAAMTAVISGLAGHIFRRPRYRE